MTFIINIKKIIFALFLFFAFLGTNLYSEIVNKVQVHGNERISSETVIIFGDITIGNNYDSSDVNLLIKKLYETDFFSDIKIELKNNKLDIFVKENPIVNSIIFKGEKASKTKEAIREYLSIRENNSYISGHIKNDINKIQEFYKLMGFYFVKIDADIEKLQKNRVNIIYLVDKGEKAKIAKIYFLGDKKIRDKRLRDIITSEESTFWKFLSRNVYLNQGRIDLDKRLLKNYYRNRGYYEVEVTSSNVEYAEGEGFVLTYSINAGKRYRFKKIYADISGELDKEAFISLGDHFTKLVGKYYSQEKLNNVLEKIDKLSEQKSLQFINHDVEETLEGDQVEVKINIFEGEKSIIEQINIAGNTVTNDGVIRGELVVDEGDPYSELLVNKSINNIKARNIFGSVIHTVSEGSEENTKVIEIAVEEQATGEIMAGAGIGTEGTSFMFAVSENNWLGKGMGLTGSLNVTEEKISGSLDIKDPNFRYSGNSVNFGFSVASTDKTATTGYETETTALNFGTSFEHYENVYLSPSLSLTYEDIVAEASASDNIKKMDGTYLNSDLGYAIIWDRRDQRYKPTDGYKATFRQSLPLIQDSSSIMNGFDVTGYHDFSEDVIGSLKFYTRTIHGVDDDVRLTNRLFMPSKRLRGFVRGKVGPKDGTDWIGGNYATAVNAEAALPNLLPESYKTDFNLFFDAGNVWEVDYSSTLNESNKIRSSVGLGANVFTMIGPLSFVLAQDITKAETDKTETFNFQLGTSF